MWNRSSKKSSKEKFTSAQQAYDCALDLLSYRDFSKKKMQERLQQKGADEEQAEEAIEKLQEYGLINDERYANRVYEAWLNKRCYGRQHLAAELSKRGIKHLKVVYSQEEARKPDVDEEELQRTGKRQIPGSVAFVPGAAGLILAGEVVKDLIK